MKRSGGGNHGDHGSDQAFFKILWCDDTRSETRIFKRDEVVVLFMEVSNKSAISLSTMST